MGSESISHEAESRESERKNLFSKIQVVGQNETKHLLLVKAGL